MTTHIVDPSGADPVAEPTSRDVVMANLPPARSAAGEAAQDLREAVHQSWFWLSLGWIDIVQRYRGSMLGPFWLTITNGFFIIGLGPLYATLFGVETKSYLPFMALGVLTWNFINGTIQESCRAFIDASGIMKQMRLPKMTVMLHVLWRNIIVFAHNIPVCMAIIIYAETPITLSIFYAVPGFVLLCANLLWIGTLLAILCLRFRDVIQIVSSILMLGFFFTPVMWNPKLHNRVGSWVVTGNPFAAFIEVVRAPLLGEVSNPTLVLSACVSLAVGTLVTALVFTRYRKQIIYWA